MTDGGELFILFVFILVYIILYLFNNMIRYICQLLVMLFPYG